MSAKAWTPVLLVVFWLLSLPCLAQKSAKAQPTPQAPEPPTLSRNCQAPHELAEEVARLLDKAASHATRSSACMDGPGERAGVDQLVVCPGRRDKDRIAVDAEYVVSRWAEGDTRMCGVRPRPKEPRSLPDLCSGKPAVNRFRASFTFVRKGKAFFIEVPREVPGLIVVPKEVQSIADVRPGATSGTALDKAHDGGCYGRSGPFVAAPVRPR
jgi:hypothetical protein